MVEVEVVEVGVVEVDVRIYQHEMVVIGLTVVITGVPRTRWAKRLVIIGVTSTVEIPTVVREPQKCIVAFVVEV